MDQLNMQNCFKELDVTSEFNSLVSSLKTGDIHLAEGFTLLDAMSASELFDQKVDTKLNLKDADTPAKLLQSSKIKKSQDLSNEEVIYTQIINLNQIDFKFIRLNLWQNHTMAIGTWIKLNHIYSSVINHPQYQSRYQYDQTLFQDNSIINSLYQFINTIGNSIFNIVKSAPFLREEDYIPNVFSFRRNSCNLQIFNMMYLVTFPQLIQLINELDSNLSKSKKAKNISIKDGLSARIKIIKGFSLLVQALTQPYNQEQHNEILNQIDFIRKRMDIVRSTLQYSVPMDNYENQTISKHIRYMISARQVPKIQMDQSLDYLENMMQQLETLLKIAQSRNLNAIIQDIDNLIHKNPKNILIRAYVEQNLFKIEQNQNITYFGKISFQQLIRQHLSQLFPLLKSQFDNPKKEIVQYLDYLQSVMYEYVIKQLRGNFRQMRDFHKIYQHFSILIHESTQLDQQLGPSNKQAFMINAYDLSLKMMLKQLLLGFELEIYHKVDYSMIFFYIEYITTIIDKNNSNFMSSLPTQAQQSIGPSIHYLNLDLPKGAKKKKYLNEVQEIFYDQINYYKALHSFAKAFSRLCYILQANKILPNEDIRYRYSNRFKIFEYCYFIKPITYSEYQNKMEELYKTEEDLTNGLNFVNEQFKEAQQNFQKYDMELAKLCVVSSLGVMKLKMNSAKIGEVKVNFKETQVPYLLVFELV